MGDLGRTIHIRLSPQLQRKLEMLHAAHYAGLPLSTVAKLLLADQLQKEGEVVLEIIQNQIKTPPEEAKAPMSGHRPSALTNSLKNRQRR